MELSSSMKCRTQNAMVFPKSQRATERRPYEIRGSAVSSRLSNINRPSGSMRAWELRGRKSFNAGITTTSSATTPTCIASAHTLQTTHCNGPLTKRTLRIRNDKSAGTTGLPADQAGSVARKRERAPATLRATQRVAPMKANKRTKHKTPAPPSPPSEVTSPKSKKGDETSPLQIAAEQEIGYGNSDSSGKRRPRNSKEWAPGRQIKGGGGYIALIMDETRVAKVFLTLLPTSVTSA